VDHASGARPHGLSVVRGVASERIAPPKFAGPAVLASPFDVAQESVSLVRPDLQENTDSSITLL
jgi:hypothetical protein